MGLGEFLRQWAGGRVVVGVVVSVLLHVLLVVGAAALIAGIQPTAIEMACHAQEELGKPLSAFCQSLVGG